MSQTISRKRKRKHLRAISTNQETKNSNQNRRINNLMASLSRYLSPEVYQALAQESLKWYPNDFFQKMIELIPTLVPYTASNNDCIAIYSYLYNQDIEALKIQIIQEGYK